MSAFIPRLYIPASLKQGISLPLPDAHLHYLLHVLKLAHPEKVKVFNGKEGEWECTFMQKSKKEFFLVCDHQLRLQGPSLDLWLVFAPLKKQALEKLIMQATELGASHLVPVQTAYSSIQFYQPQKAETYAIEAAEQSEQLQIPTLGKLIKLEELLKNWPEDRTLYACIERSEENLPLWKAIQQEKKAAFLIGPEGGFSPQEIELLKNHPSIRPVSLGPSILRAETAATVALGCFVQKRLCSND